jgi:hypothetical protein
MTWSKDEELEFEEFGVHGDVWDSSIMQVLCTSSREVTDIRSSGRPTYTSVLIIWQSASHKPVMACHCSMAATSARTFDLRVPERLSGTMLGTSECRHARCWTEEIANENETLRHASRWQTLRRWDGRSFQDDDPSSSEQ